MTTEPVEEEENHLTVEKREPFFYGQLDVVNVKLYSSSVQHLNEKGILSRYKFYKIYIHVRWKEVKQDV